MDNKNKDKRENKADTHTLAIIMIIITIIAKMKQTVKNLVKDTRSSRDLLFALWSDSVRVKSSAVSTAHTHLMYTCCIGF